MAWGDIAAGLGGALESGLSTYKWQQERKDKKEHDELVNDIKMQLQQVKGEQAKEQINLRQQGKMALQDLMNTGKINLADVEGKWDQTIAKAHEDGLITRDEMKALNNLEVADRNAAARRYAADAAERSRKYAADKQLEGTDISSGRALQSSLYGTNVGANTAANAEAGRNQRFFQGTLPVARGNMEANQARAANAGDPYNLKPESAKPKFKGFMEMLREEQDRGQAPFQGPVDPQVQPQGLAPAPQPGMSPRSAPAPAPAPGVTPPVTAPPVPAPAPVVRPSAPVRARPTVSGAPVQQAPPEPQGVPPILQGAGRRPQAAAAPSSQLSQQITELATRVLQMPPGPEKQQAQQQLAILRSQLQALATRGQ